MDELAERLRELDGRDDAVPLEAVTARARRGSLRAAAASVLVLGLVAVGVLTIWPGNARPDAVPAGSATPSDVPEQEFAEPCPVPPEGLLDSIDSILRQPTVDGASKQLAPAVGVARVTVCRYTRYNDDPHADTFTLTPVGERELSNPEVAALALAEAEFTVEEQRFCAAVFHTEISVYLTVLDYPVGRVSVFSGAGCGASLTNGVHVEPASPGEGAPLMHEAYESGSWPA